MRILAVLAVVACGGGGAKSPDAAAPVDAVAVDALAPPTTSSHVVFLDYESETFNPGSDNPATNSSGIASKVGTLVGYKLGDANRATILASITDEVAAIVAPYDIQVVSARPASGVYDLIVITSSNGTPIGAPANASALTSTFCGGTLPPAEVSFIFAAHTLNLGSHQIAGLAVAVFASDHGVPFSSKAADCMCYAAAGCTPLTSAACTIGGANTPVDTPHYGCGGATMDERAEFLRVFGPR